MSAIPHTTIGTLTAHLADYNRCPTVHTFLCRCLGSRRYGPICRITGRGAVSGLWRFHLMSPISGTHTFIPSGLLVPRLSFSYFFFFCLLIHFKCIFLRQVNDFPSPFFFLSISLFSLSLPSFSCLIQIPCPSFFFSLPLSTSLSLSLHVSFFPCLLLCLFR